MKKVYSSDSFYLVGLLRQLLEDQHIKCITKNEYLLGGAGELPPTECWPELWVTDDEQVDRARSLVEAMLAIDMETATDWSCHGCGEAIEGQFSACWNCGETRRHDGAERNPR